MFHKNNKHYYIYVGYVSHGVFIFFQSVCHCYIRTTLVSFHHR